VTGARRLNPGQAQQAVYHMGLGVEYPSIISGKLTGSTPSHKIHLDSNQPEPEISQ